MPWLEHRGNSYRIKFRFSKQNYCVPLKTEDEREAAGPLVRFEDNLRLLNRGCANVVVAAFLSFYPQSTMTLRWLLLAEIAFGMPGLAAAQQTQADRRAREEPEIAVEAGGRVGPCDALLFTDNGLHLLAGGDDKVVRVWPVSATGLDTDPAKVQVLRWRAWREQRGGIKTVAVSADGKRVAVGGYGMKPSTVAVIDRESGDQLGLTWPLSVRGRANFGAVMAVAFHPDGKRIGFGTADGSLWLWTPERLPKPDKEGRSSQLPVLVGKHTPQLDDNDRPLEFNFPRLIYFPRENQLASVAASGEVRACAIPAKATDSAIDPPQSTAIFNANAGLTPRYAVYRAAATADAKWLAIGFGGPRAVVRSTDGREKVPFALPEGSFVRSIAMSRDGSKLAVGVAAAMTPAAGKPRFYAEGNDRILLFDKPTAGESKPVELAHRGPAESLAFDPVQNRLAVAGGDADEVSLHDLTKPELAPSAVRGAGRRLWSVNLAENGRVIGVRTDRDPATTDPNQRGTGSWFRFDLTRLAPTADESQKWIDPVTEADGWVIEQNKDDRYIWEAVLKRAAVDVRFKLDLDRYRDQAPTCFTFLPAKDGKPTRVLVGHYYGCSLFELTLTGAKQTKLYTGHAGEVLSVVAAKDQSWFVTGGSDHTVAAWSLVDWKAHPGLGATFEEKDGMVEVAALDTGSPAWEAGLRVGDALDFLSVGGDPVFERRPGNPELGTTAALLAALKDPRPRIELFFGWVSKGQAKHLESLTTVRQRPMWKWFPAFNDRGRLTDWVVWMWHGSYYHTKSAHGDRLVGWHVNSPEPGGRPEFYQLQQFEKQFHRLDAIEKIVTGRDVGAAILEVRGNNPLPVSFNIYEPAPVRLGLGRTTVGDDGLPIAIGVKSRGNDPELLPERVELWLNDHRLEVWPKPGQALDPAKPFEAPLTIAPDKFRTGENQIAVLTFNSAGGRAEAMRTVTNERAALPTNLVGLTVGIDDYSGHRKNAGGARSFGDLTNARKDAGDLTESLLKYRGPGKFFPQGQIDLRLDAQASRKQLVASLKAVAESAKPDDLLVVFFAGHGDLLLPGPKGGTIPDAIEPGEMPKGARGIAAGGGLFVFCCPEYSAKDPTNTAISAEELFDALARVNCRKVVLLDACHSGQAAEANLLRRVAPNGLGPFVIASCDQGELAFEHPKLNHGLFTFAVLDALGNGFRKADADSNGKLTADELFDHVATSMPDLLRKIGKPIDVQNPICFPRQPPRFVVVKK